MTRYILIIILIIVVALVLRWYWQSSGYVVGGAADSANYIYTIGHSTTPIDDFVKHLQANHVEVLVDVRTLPGSERYPQFNKESLMQTLPRHNIKYVHMPELGGLRKPHADSINTGWRNKSFRAYADYMQTPEFTSALHDLIKLASDHTVCIMCSEAVPWRCHRNLIGDALTIRSWRVMDIIGAKTTPHRMTPFAVVDGTTVTYPAYGNKN